MITEVSIRTEYITLGQFLKLANVIDSGGMAKWFLDQYPIKINGENENRRGKKLRIGDSIVIEGKGSFVVTSEIE